MGSWTKQLIERLRNGRKIEPPKPPSRAVQTMSLSCMDCHHGVEMPGVAYSQYDGMPGGCPMCGGRMRVASVRITGEPEPEPAVVAEDVN